ncbi:MAG: hypothetical protein IJM25_12020 [Eubacterium sp.]|nr:hypothetical protein [Eubacterium sp.]
MEYEIPVRFSGRIMYHISADSEGEAREKATELAEDADCGQLEDIDWEVKPAVATYQDREVAHDACNSLL